MVKLELYELKEKLVELNIDFPQNATRTELENLLLKTSETKDDEKGFDAIEEKKIEKVNRVSEETKDGMAKPLETSKKEAPVAEKKKRKKRYNRSVVVEESDAVAKTYVVIGNIKGLAKGQPFISSESQINQMLECGAIKEC